MKIGFVLDDSLDKTDGVQQYVLTLGAWFQKTGHEVHYLVGETKRADMPNLHSLSRNIAVRFNKNRMSMPLLTNRRAIKGLLKRERFDVLHVQMPYSPLMAARVIMAAPLQTAIVGTFHIIPFSNMQRRANKVLAFSLRRSLQRFDAVLSVSEPAQIFAEKIFSLDSQVLPNVVDITFFAKGRRISQYSDANTTLVFLGRLVERKGCRQLLEAVNQLKNQISTHFRVLICGDGPLRGELEAYCQKNDLTDIVEFCGFLPEEAKRDYLATADIAVFPSLGGESFGIVLIEAMAAGSGVVIGGNNPGYASVLGEWPQTLVNPLNPKQFAERLKNLINDKANRSRLHGLQQQGVSQYSLDVVAPKLFEVYKTAIAKRAED